MKELGLYIHIPFCKKKCAYCDFTSYVNKNSLIEKYVESIKKEIERESNMVKDYNVTTIYIGGGTPSFIDSNFILQILNMIKEHYNIIENAEITIEINPGTVTEKTLLDYKIAGINRLSIGLQETNNNLLKLIGRIHTYEEFAKNYNLIRKIGFNNINIDLMIGLPNQELKDVENSLNKIINLNPEHISVYSLIVEEGTTIAKKINNGELTLPDEEIERQEYWLVKTKLEEVGYKHYEISNFAKPNKESKHNTNCWLQKEYIGFGAAAHSYLNNVRYYNTQKIEEYIKGIEKNNENNTLKIIEEEQNIEDQIKEYMLLGLRRIEGVKISEFKNKFGNNLIILFKNELNKLVEEGLIEIDLDQIKLTNKGIDLANLVWEEFV